MRRFLFLVVFVRHCQVVFQLRCYAFPPLGHNHRLVGPQVQPDREWLLYNRFSANDRIAGLQVPDWIFWSWEKDLGILKRIHTHPYHKAIFNRVLVDRGTECR